MQTENSWSGFKLRCYYFLQLDVTVMIFICVIKCFWIKVARFQNCFTCHSKDILKFMFDSFRIYNFPFSHISFIRCVRLAWFDGNLIWMSVNNFAVSNTWFSNRLEKEENNSRTSARGMGSFSKIHILCELKQQHYQKR